MAGCFRAVYLERLCHDQVCEQRGQSLTPIVIYHKNWPISEKIVKEKVIDAGDDVMECNGVQNHGSCVRQGDCTASA